MEFKIICDIRENLKQNIICNNINFSDHPPKDNIQEIQNYVIQSGYKCSIFGGIPELIAAVNAHKTFNDCIFLNLTDGLDTNCGRVQAPILLEILGVKYSGAEPFQSALVNNKYFSKLAVKGKNILTPSSLLVSNKDYYDIDLLKKLSYPIIIKPNTKGSSIGITQKSICYDYKYANILLENLLVTYEEVLLETFIPGYEVTNFIIGNKGIYPINCPVLEEFHGNMIHQNEVMSIEDKALRTRTFHLCDNILGKNITEKIKQTSIIIKETLNVNDILRIDYRITENGDIYFIEANTVPRICSKNEAGFICKSNNKPPHYIIKSLLQSVISR